MGLGGAGRRRFGDYGPGSLSLWPGRWWLPPVVVMTMSRQLQPVAPNANPDGTDNPEGRRQNRRVEIIVTG